MGVEEDPEREERGGRAARRPFDVRAVVEVVGVLAYEGLGRKARGDRVVVVFVRERPSSCSTGTHVADRVLAAP